MSLLQPNAVPAEARLNGEVGRIKSAPRRLTEMMVREWETNYNMLWTEVGGVTPTQRLEKLGQADAEELILESRALIEFLVARLTGKDDDLVARLVTKASGTPTVEFDVDGVVTLTPA